LPLTDSEFRALTRQVYRDIVLDTAANLAFCLGVYLVFSRHAAEFPAWLRMPETLALLVATGLINLKFLMPRVRRLRLWQQERLARRER
jgi:hypothetical protein